jgi:serine phosphatase RsbU (regulator of sigma subunit)
MDSQPHLRIHAINVYVKDQDRSLRFYVDQLGFDLVYDARLQSGERWVAVAPPDGAAVLSLVAPARNSIEFKLIGRATQIVFITDDVMAKFHEWTERGVRFRHLPRLQRIKYEQRDADSDDSTMLLGRQTPIWGRIFTRFEDVDHNSFALVSFDEVSQQLEAERQKILQRQEIERRAAQELEIAKQVQSRLFPQHLPSLRTLDYAGLCIQARQVGGDYYDFVTLGSDRVGLVIGDVSGKGIAAALMMANLHANLRSHCAIASDHPQRLLRSVNQLFYENTNDSAYATLFFADYNDNERRLRYVNCGHLAALLLRKDGMVERLDSPGTVLGLFDQWDCFPGDCQLQTGDTLALYTDGVTEAFNEAGEEFGEQRLLETLQRHREASATDLARLVVDEVRAFNIHEQHDDITLIVAKCREG